MNAYRPRIPWRVAVVIPVVVIMLATAVVTLVLASFGAALLAAADLAVPFFKRSSDVIDDWVRGD